MRLIVYHVFVFIDIYVLQKYTNLDNDVKISLLDALIHILCCFIVLFDRNGIWVFIYMDVATLFLFAEKVNLSRLVCLGEGQISTSDIDIPVILANKHGPLSAINTTYSQLD